MARYCSNPPHVWGTTAANTAFDASYDVWGMDASAAWEVPASSSAPISSWASQVDLQNSECVSASEGPRDSSIVSMPQLFSSSGDTAGCETIAPSGSDDGPAPSKVNDVNDTSGRSKSKSATGVMVPVMPSNPDAIVLKVMILLVAMS